MLAHTVRHLCHFTHHLLAVGLLCSTWVAVAAPADAPRLGMGQDAPNTPVMIKNLRLSDPLVRAKYLGDPDLLRFLRGAYSEACVRGTLNEVATAIKVDLKREFKEDARKLMRDLVETRRIFKLNSLELEAMFDQGYWKAAYYCDCITQEITDADLVDPAKGGDEVGKLSEKTHRTCHVLAEEKAAEREKRRK